MLPFWAKHMSCRNSIWACWSFEQNRSCVVFEAVLKMRRRKADWARGEGLYTTGVPGCTCSADEAPTLHPVTRLGEKSSNTKPGKVKGWTHLENNEGMKTSRLSHGQLTNASSPKQARNRISWSQKTQYTHACLYPTMTPYSRSPNEHP